MSLCVFLILESIEKEGEVVFNYHETMISHIVEARENKEFEYICSEIQDFIERENIDICFVINKDELIDCLQEHQKLKLKIADLETKLAESEKEVKKLRRRNTDAYLKYYHSHKEQISKKRKELYRAKKEKQKCQNQV